MGPVRLRNNCLSDQSEESNRLKIRILHFAQDDEKAKRRIFAQAAVPLVFHESEAPHFCHPETSRISLTREGSIKYNDYGIKITVIYMDDVI